MGRVMLGKKKGEAGRREKSERTRAKANARVCKSKGKAKPIVGCVHEHVESMPLACHGACQGRVERRVEGVLSRACRAACREK